mmetsp:Transcript_20094/g.51779  ORF Transcript_20094/g.51779 Transcript_20094/m.51779 type:complete len:398 (-) Transcript_20094:146-1339(-)
MWRLRCLALLALVLSISSVDSWHSPHRVRSGTRPLGAMNKRAQLQNTARLDRTPLDLSQQNELHDLVSFPVHERYTTSSLWLHAIETLPRSSVLRGIRAPILACIAWSTVLAMLHSAIGFSIPCSRPHTLLSWALALLLVFRTNSSYNRFWEGRKIWERLVNRCRDLVRMGMVYRDAIGMRRLRRMACMIRIFPAVVREHVQRDRRHSQRKARVGGDASGRKMLDDDELVHCLDSYDQHAMHRVRNKALFVCNTLAREIRAIQTDESLDFSSRERLMMLTMVNDLSACIGACERIVQTPIPLQYARHTSRFLCLWVFTLPLLLLPEMGFWVIPAMACISWTLFGIQELGLQIENPFESILSLEIMSGMNAQSVDETLALIPEYELELAPNAPGFRTA